MNLNCKYKNNFSVTQPRKSERGFSLIELMIVLIIISIGVAVSLFYFSGHRRLYRTEDQALNIIDILQKARQFALTQRQIMRVDFNTTLRTVTLTDENSPATAADDVMLDSLPIDNNLRIDPAPAGVTAPTESFPADYTTFSASVFTLRFNSNGTVLRTGPTPQSGTTIIIWEPDQASPANARDLALVRAVTVLAASGATHYWLHSATIAGGVGGTGWERPQ